MRHFEAIVLGVGGVGSAALYHLARRGVRTLGLDAFEPGHDRGSSHGGSRIIRQAYYEHADYVPLVLRAYRLWSELSESRGECLYEQIGLLQIGPSDGEVLPGVLASAAAHGLELDTLSPREVIARWPGFGIPESLSAVFERQAGFLHVEACVRAHIDEALRLGASLQTGQQVRRWRAAGGGVTVETATESYEADVLVIAAGAWARDLLADLDLPLEIRRKSVFWYQAPEAAYRTDTGYPCFLYELPEGIFYGVPAFDDRGFKVAEHTGGQAVADPLAVDRQLYADERAKIEAFMSACLSQAGRRLLDHSVCMYTMSPDAHFIVDRHPEHAQVVFAAGLSGHGFKFTCVLGEALADLAIDGRTQLPIEFLSRRRLTGR